MRPGGVFSCRSADGEEAHGWSWGGGVNGVNNNTFCMPPSVSIDTPFFSSLLPFLSSLLFLWAIRRRYTGMGLEWKERVGRFGWDTHLGWSFIIIRDTREQKG